MSSGYLLRPVAEQELDDLAFFYAAAAGIDLGQRFLAAAHDTFALLAGQPHIGWHPHLCHLALRELRVPPNGIEIPRIIHGAICKRCCVAAVWPETQPRPPRAPVTPLKIFPRDS